MSADSDNDDKISWEEFKAMIFGIPLEETKKQTMPQSISTQGSQPEMSAGGPMNQSVDINLS